MGPNKQRRATARRKKRQQELRHLMRLREQALNYEGMSATRVARMSPEEVARVVRSGRQRRMRMVSPFDGIALAMAAASAVRR